MLQHPRSTHVITSRVVAAGVRRCGRRSHRVGRGRRRPPARPVRVLRNKLWGFTVAFSAQGETFTLKIAAPALFPAAHLAHGAAQRAAPDAVPELVRHEARSGQSWTLFRFVDGVPARVGGAEAVISVADTIARIQATVAHELPPGVPVLPASAVAGLLVDLDDQPRSLVGELDEQREALAVWGSELDALVPLSLDHVDLHLENVVRSRDGRFVILDWEEAIVSSPLFSFDRLRIDAIDHGAARLAERAYVQRLLPDLDHAGQRRAVALARALVPLKLAHEARTFARGLGWADPHTRLTTHHIRAALDAAGAITGRRAPRPARPRSEVTIELRERGSGDVCRQVLDTLPSWFGLPDANEEHIAAAEHGRALVAVLDGDAVGLLVPVRHADAAAEIHLLAVAAPHRRKGIGGALVDAAERLLLDDGVDVLQVKTLSARRSDDGYEETRAFYRSVGFVHLEEHPTLWDAANPALQMVKVLGEPGR